MHSLTINIIILLLNWLLILYFNVIQGSITQWEQRPSLTSTATQDTILEDRISLTTSNDIHDNAYTLEPAVTVNVNNDTVSMTATNTAVTAAPTYAVVAKRTDATAIPNVDQRVVYDQVTGDINKVSTFKRCLILLYLSFRKEEMSLSIHLMEC